MFGATRALKQFVTCALIALVCIHRTAPASESAVPTPQSAAPGVHVLTAQDLESFLDRFVPEQLSKRSIAGAVVVAVSNGNVLLSRGYGFADIERRIPMSAESTLVRPGSITKLFVAIAVVQLVEQGQLDLDRDVNDYLDFHIPTPQGGVPVTLRRLLTHRAGFENHLKDLFSTGPMPQQLGEWLRVSLPPRLFPDGDVPAYSNYGYGLAGYIVERASGERFENYLAARILQPLGMTRSTLAQPLPSDLASHMSRGYGSSTASPLPYFETVTPPPAGAMSVTAADMGRFLLAVSKGSRQNSIEIPSHVSSAPSPSTYPLLGLEQDHAAGNVFWGKHGMTLAFVSEVAWLPTAELGLFVSYNSATAQGAPTDLLHAIAERYFKRAEPTLPESSSALRDTAAFAGAYRPTLRMESSFLRLFGLLARPFIVTALPDGNIELSGFPGQPLQQTEPLAFRAENGLKVNFTRRASGDLLTMHVSAIPLPMEWERLPWYLDARFVVPAVTTSAAVVAATLLAWPVAAWVRRRRGRGFGNTLQDRRQYRWMRAVLGINLLVCLGVVRLIDTSADITRFNTALDPWLALLYAGAWLSVIGAAVTIWVAIRFWCDAVGSRWARIHHTVLAAACSVLAWFWLTWRIAGTTLNY